jgi:hypothetical protein
MLRAPIATVLSCVALVGASVPPKPLAILKPALHQYEDGPALAPGTGFATGESVFLSFLVSGYQVSESEDSQVNLVCRIDALDPQGVPLVATMRQEIRTTVSAEDKNWMPIVRQSFLIPPLAPPGDYRIVIVVEDLLASQEAKTEVHFPVRGRQVAPSDTLLARNVRFLRGEDDLQPLDPPVYRPGNPVWVRFDIVGYKSGEKNRLQFSYGVSVLGPSGKTVYSEPQAALEDGQSFYPKHYLPGTFSLSLTADVRPGTYTIVLTLRDEIGNQTVESKHEFTVQ